MPKISTWLFVFLTVFAGSLFAQEHNMQPDSPYGVCAHLGVGEEYDQIPRNLEKMYDAGIRWARADFTWGYFEYEQGKWRFDNYDRLMDQAEKTGICILPILDYSVPWANPAHTHLEAWLDYVYKIVTRYQDRIRYWEVWNEENIVNFWKDKPNAADYTTLLKRTYEVIKAINPELQVVYGGLAGVPHSYFEDCLKAGAGKYFDIINIHPYRGGLIHSKANEKFIADIEKFNQLLTQYHEPTRPVWITEMGWTTPPGFSESDQDIVPVAIHFISPDIKPACVGYIYDEHYCVSLQYPPQFMQSMIPDDIDKMELKLNDLKTLDCHKVPFLIMPPGETFPTDYFEDLVRYVRDGGTLFLTGGVPLYYETKLENGVLEKQEQSASEKWREQLRIGWFAWWTRQGTPEEAPNQPTEETAPLFTHLSTQTQGTRFFDNSRLKEGDKMIPLLLSKKDDFQAPAAVLYRFNSDWKGNLVVSSLTSFGFITNTSTVDNQGVFLPQSYLMAFAAGVEKFFWYEFQATEIDPNEREHYFGIVHKDLSEKPAYIAYRTLTGARPAGSVQMPGWKQGDCCVIQWRRPDGQNGWALWSPSGEITKKVRISGSVVEAFDYLGQSVSPDVNTETLTLSPKILYLIGPDSIELQ